MLNDVFMKMTFKVFLNLNLASVLVRDVLFIITLVRSTPETKETNGGRCQSETFL